jgi:hypothetical protein
MVLMDKLPASTFDEVSERQSLISVSLECTVLFFHLALDQVAGDQHPDYYEDAAKVSLTMTCASSRMWRK